MKGRFRRPKGIPVGKDGYVPEREIVRRYQEVGDFSDSNTDKPVILPRNLKTATDSDDDALFG